MSTLQARVARLTLAMTPPASAQPPRTFSTFDGMTFVEIMAGASDYRHAIIGANGEWLAGVATISPRELDAIKRNGKVLVIAWKEQGHE